jgi:hypothetical protein
MERIEPLAGVDRIDRYRGATVAYQNRGADTLGSASSANTTLRPLDIPTNMSVNVRCSSDTGTGRRPGRPASRPPPRGLNGD